MGTHPNLADEDYACEFPEWARLLRSRPLEPRQTSTRPSLPTQNTAERTCALCEDCGSEIADPARPWRHVCAFWND